MNNFNQALLEVISVMVQEIIEQLENILNN